MKTFKIEDGIPLPTHKGGNGMSDVLRRLKFGQSVFFDGASDNQVSSAMQYAKTSTGFKFISRKEGEGRRVWRAA